MNDKDIECCNNNNQQQQEVVEEELQGLVINNSQQTTTTIPLEIASRQSLNNSSTDSVEDINLSSPLSKRLFFDISNRASSSSCCIRKKKKYRQIKSILAIVIAIIILLSVALITRRIFSSSQSASFDWTEDSSNKDDTAEDNSDMTPSTNNDNKDTTACNYNTGQCDKPYKDPTNQHIKNEPNPPQLPSSMILFHPPTCYVESLDIMNKVKEYSDPIVTWDDHVANTNTTTAQTTIQTSTTILINLIITKMKRGQRIIQSIHTQQPNTLQPNVQHYYSHPVHIPM